MGLFEKRFFQNEVRLKNFAKEIFSTEPTRAVQVRSVRKEKVTHFEREVHWAEKMEKCWNLSFSMR